MDSILTTIKKMLGITKEYKQFDVDIITHINSALSILTRQLGVGPAEGFMIEDDSAEWRELIDESDMMRFNDVKTYIYYKVRLAFDPPDRANVMESMAKQISELEWRLNLEAESTKSE